MKKNVMSERREKKEQKIRNGKVREKRKKHLSELKIENVMPA